MAPPGGGQSPRPVVTGEEILSHAGGGEAGQVGLQGPPRRSVQTASMVSAGGFSLLGPDGLLLLGHPPQPSPPAARTPSKLNTYSSVPQPVQEVAQWRSEGGRAPWQSGRCSAGAWWPGACSGRGRRGLAQCPAALGASSRAYPRGGSLRPALDEPPS